MKSLPEGIAGKHEVTRATERYVLSLYISGATPRSTRAITNINAICEKHMLDCYDLEVIDAFQQPDLVRKHQVLVFPTLIKRSPLPLRRIIGDLSNEAAILMHFGILPSEPEQSETSE